MCGIAGIVDITGAPVDRDVVARMNDAISHRGPDDQGVWFDGPVGLAHRRLSIIDLSPAGHQPMCNHDGTLWITYNGEVYNFQEIRPELERAGYRFRSRTDTEVILHAFEEWGPDCLSRFNGMFAFAIWDMRRRRLFIARDRFGIKPIYYWCDGRRFCFASEIKGLLAHPDVPRRPDLAVAYDYLAEGMMDHTDQTFFEGIRRFPASSAMYVGPEKIASWKYFSIEPGARRDMEPADAVATFRELFADAVRLRLISDVRVGTNLSGGLDSSCVASMVIDSLRKNGGTLPHITFSACFHDPEIDERPFIELAARDLPLELKFCFPPEEDLREQIVSLMCCQDQPVMSAAMIAKRHVMKLARDNGVKVVLEGQGADEHSAGYTEAAAPAIADQVRSGRWLAAARQFEAYCRVRGASPRDAARQVARHVMPAALTDAISRANDRRLPWVGAHLLRYAGQTPQPRFADGELDNWCLTGLSHHFLPFYLRTDDHNAMDNGVEGRLPFLDYRLVEFVLSLDGDLRIRDSVGKWIIRESMAGIVPDTIRLFPGKRPFPTSEHVWLRGSQRASIEELLSSRSFQSREMFDAAGAREVFEQFCNGREDLRLIVWRLINYELWLQCFRM